MSRRVLKSELENEASVGHHARDFAKLVIRAKEGDIKRFRIEEPFLDPPNQWGGAVERAVILEGAFAGEQRFGGGVVVFDDPGGWGEDAMPTYRVARLIERFSVPIPTLHPPFAKALVKALQRLDDMIGESQDAGMWPRKKASS